MNRRGQIPHARERPVFGEQRLPTIGQEAIHAAESVDNLFGIVRGNPLFPIQPDQVQMGFVCSACRFNCIASVLMCCQTFR